MTERLDDEALPQETAGWVERPNPFHTREKTAQMLKEFDYASGQVTEKLKTSLS